MCHRARLLCPQLTCSHDGLVAAVALLLDEDNDLLPVLLAVALGVGSREWGA
jgi:hypothetical protein